MLSRSIFQPASPLLVLLLSLTSFPSSAEVVDCSSASQDVDGWTCSGFSVTCLGTSEDDTIYNPSGRQDILDAQSSSALLNPLRFFPEAGFYYMWPGAF